MRRGQIDPFYRPGAAGPQAATRSLARLGAPEVLVNCVAPGLIESEMTTAEIDSEAGQAKIRATMPKLGLGEEALG